MIRFHITATLETPLSLTQDRQSANPETLPYIPGRTLRGALAAVFLRSADASDPLFGKLFVDELQTRFSPLYPGQHSVPLTAVSCKRFPGFSQTGKGAHGVVDHLLLRIAHQLGTSVALQESLLCSHHNMGTSCSQDLKAFTGFYTNSQSKKLQRSTRTHVGIDRLTQIASEGILYSQQELSPGQTLEGTLVTQPGLADELVRLCSSPLRLGRSRTRGKGRVSLQLQPLQEKSEPQLVEQWREWSNKAKYFVQKTWKPSGIEKNEIWFALTLHSHTILVDRFLRPTCDPADMLEWLPPIPSSETSGTTQKVFGSGKISLATCMLKTRLERGWHAAHGLPCTDDLALERGSVFAYRLQSPSTQDVELLYRRLFSLHQHGIGLRRNEGFGMVTVCDPFHLNVTHQTVS